MSFHEPEIDIPIFAEEGAELPQYASMGASGADVRAYIKDKLVIAPGTSALLSTGLRFDIPEGYEIQVRPRSGLALKHQVTVLNTPGTIDADYRGELKIILINHGKEPFVVEPQMRIAQIVVAPVTRATFLQASNNLAETKRGAGGFGHTGLN